MYLSLLTSTTSPYSEWHSGNPFFLFLLGNHNRPSPEWHSDVTSHFLNPYPSLFTLLSHRLTIQEFLCAFLSTPLSATFPSSNFRQYGANRPCLRSHLGNNQRRYSSLHPILQHHLAVSSLPPVPRRGIGCL